MRRHPVGFGSGPDGYLTGLLVRDRPIDWSVNQAGKQLISRAAQVRGGCEGATRFIEEQPV
jgi:hypothetical protein